MGLAGRAQQRADRAPNNEAERHAPQGPAVGKIQNPTAVQPRGTSFSQLVTNQVTLARVLFDDAFRLQVRRRRERRISRAQAGREPRPVPGIRSAVLVASASRCRSIPMAVAETGASQTTDARWIKRCTGVSEPGMQEAWKGALPRGWPLRPKLASGRADVRR